MIACAEPARVMSWFRWRAEHVAPATPLSQ
jgi:hypothetical protein